MKICANDEHPEKVISPIEVTEEGIEICFNLLHHLKHSLSNSNWPWYVIYKILFEDFSFKFYKKYLSVLNDFNFIQNIFNNLEIFILASIIKTGFVIYISWGKYEKS